MKHLCFHYHMQIDFDIPVKDHHFTLKCLPKDSRRQHIEKLHYEVFPNRFISRSGDSFGNECIYGVYEDPHKEFLIDVKGEALCGLKEYETEGNRTDANFFKYQTAHTVPGANIEKYHDELIRRFAGSQDRVREKAEFYMKCLHEDYEYKSGSTRIATTAEEAFSQGCGVCQDFAHIFLSLLRMEKIPCRYVTGMLLGEGLSHAWIEYFSDGLWIALDPTNEKVISDEHIKIASGRDYSDCRINQGVFMGCDREAKQDQQICVSVEECV